MGYRTSSGHWHLIASAVLGLGSNIAVADGINSLPLELAQYAPTPIAPPPGTPLAAQNVGADLVVPLPYSVIVNGKPQGDAVLLQLRDGGLLALASDLQRWRLLNTNPSERFQLDGDDYYRLNALPGFRYRLNSASQQIELDFAADAFAVSRVAARQRHLVTPQAPQSVGGFFNYDFLASRQQIASSQTVDSLSGLFETGLFHSWGVLTSQWVGQNLAGDQNLNGAEPLSRELIRLGTTYTHDDPDRMQTLTLGDTVGGSGLTGRPVRIGGIRLARNFSTQPGYLTLPQPTLSGEAALPSVLDIYVNGLLNQSQNLPAGPFQVDAVPVINGRGEVEVVVRDLLGREQVIAQSYFTGARQLRAGLDDYSYEAGLLRRSFGVENADYGDFVVVGSHRYGFSDRFTGEARVELQEDGPKGAGLGGIVSILPIGVVSGALAVSTNQGESGAQGLIGLERTVRRSLSLGVRYQYATTDYRQAGTSSLLAPPAEVLNANASYGLPGIGTAGLSYFRIERRNPETITSIITSSFTTTYRRMSFNLLGSMRLDPRRNYAVSLRVGIPLGRRDYLSSGYRHNQTGDGFVSGRSFVNLQKNLPHGEGWGYTARVSETHSENRDTQLDALGAASWNAPYGSYVAEVARAGDRSAYRASASGGIGAMAGHVFASRRINNSFAIVDTGVEGVGLKVYNQRSASTNAQGFAVLPNIQPYQSNVVEIDHSNLPMDVETPASRVEIAPYFRSGVLVELPARRALGATMQVLQANGQPVPAGANIRLGELEYPVGIQGFAFVSGLQPGINTATVHWDQDRQCQLRLDLVANAGFQPDLGPVTCD